MSFKQRIKKTLTGITIPREYCCVSLEDFRDPLKVFISDDHFSLDVTNQHVLLGYKPVIFAIPLLKEDPANEHFRKQSKITLHFIDPDNLDSVQRGSIRSVAKLQLSKIKEGMIDDEVILVYQCTHGHHAFLSSLQKFVNRQRDKFQKRPSGNIDLPGNLLDQVQMSYSVPRKISIITTGHDLKYNLFPTDLHGQIGKRKYMSSLRVGGHATQQVEAYRNVVISDMDASYYKEVYAMGKNHMSPLRNSDAFNLSGLFSDNFGYPLPLGIKRYKEMTLENSFDHGIHRIHVYDIVHERELHQALPTLTHIHRVYAEWRRKKGFNDALYFS